MAPFKHGETDFVFKSSNPTANRGRFDSERLGGPCKVARDRRRLEIYQIADLHFVHAMQILLCAASDEIDNRSWSEPRAGGLSTDDGASVVIASVVRRSIATSCSCVSRRNRGAAASPGDSAATFITARRTRIYVTAGPRASSVHVSETSEISNDIGTLRSF